MISNSRGQVQTRVLSHIGLWLVAIGLVVFLSWSAVNKKSEDNTYRSGSVDNSRVVNVYPLGMAPGCDYIKADGNPIRSTGAKKK